LGLGTGYQDGVALSRYVGERGHARALIGQDLDLFQRLVQGVAVIGVARQR